MATVEKHGKGYRITVSGGMDADGKQIRHRMMWKPEPGMSARQEKQELRRQVVRFEERVKAGLVVSGGNIRFADFAELYMKEYAEVCLNPSSVAVHWQLLKRINAALGHIKLKDLTVLHIQVFYRQLQKEGVRGRVTAVAKPILMEYLEVDKWERGDANKWAKAAGITYQTLNTAINGCTVETGTAEKIAAAVGKPVEFLFKVTENPKPLAPSTIRAYHRVVSSILEKAVRWGYLDGNPASKAELPPMRKQKARYLDEEDARRMLELLQSEPMKWRAPLTFDLLSGLRKGELLGLRWDDVNLDTGVIHIEQTWNYTPGKGTYVGIPKTEQSGRSLRISKTAVMVLLEYREWQDAQRSITGDAWQDKDGRVFTDEEGKPLHPYTLTEWLRHFVKRTGLPDITVHSLRHTYASLMIADGIPIVAVSGNLGHAQTSTTVNIYAHMIASVEARASKVMDRFSEAIHPKVTPKGKKEGIL